ncbi:MAG: SPOR domain-containing protein [Syntrophobacteraceae bacterium]
MRKKLVLQRNLRKGGGGGQPYLKYLVISAVCLIFLVLITDHYFKGKTKDLSKTPLPERGAITKEVPKQSEPSAPEGLSELTKPAEPVRPPETKPPGAETEREGIKTSEVQPAFQPPAPSPAAPQKPSTLEAPPEGKVSKSDEAAPKDLFPKKGVRSQAPEAPAVKAPAKPTAKAAVPAPPTPSAKPAPSTEKGDYAIQVGAIFKERSQAESVKKDLAAKGYRAVIGPAADGCGFVVTTSPCPQSKAYTLLEQMRIQGLSNTKVIKVAPARPPAPKPAQ